MKKHPEQNEQFEAQLRNLPDTVNQSLAGLTAGTKLNNRIQRSEEHTSELQSPS